MADVRGTKRNRSEEGVKTNRIKPHKPPAAKKPRVKQTFRNAYCLEWPVIRKSTLGIYHAFCTVCSADLSIEHGGKSDIAKHLKTEKHQNQAKLREVNVKKVPDFFIAKTDVGVINAQVLFTDFLVEHNIPLAASDHAGSLFRRMFPDSEIAKKYGCGHTKSSCIVEVLAKGDAANIAEVMRSQPYSIATDGSNDYGAAKLYPIVVRYFDQKFGRVVCVLLVMKECTESSTGENIFKLMDTELTNRNIPWVNCLSFAADNASVMMGKSKGVASFVHKKAPAVYMLGCACHLTHLAAGKAADALATKIDELLIDIFYYLDKSSKRHQTLMKFQVLCDTEMHKILKHVSVRWLSIGTCLGRLLEQWTALAAMFKEECKHDKKKKTTADVPSKPTGKNKETAAKESSTLITTKDRPSDTKRRSEKENTSGSAAVSSSKTCCRDNLNTTRTKSHAGTSTTKQPAKLTTAAGKESASQFDLTRFLFNEKQIAEKSAAAKAQDKLNEDLRKKEYVKSSTDSRAYHIHRLLDDPFTKLNCLFLHAAIPLFDKVNTILQKDEPCIHILHSVLVDLLHSILVRFVKPSIITAASKITEVNFTKLENHKCKEDIVIGTATSEFMNENGVALASRLQKFYESVIKYYITACQYIIDKFPLSDEVLINAEVANINTRELQSFQKLTFFVKQFKCLLPQSVSMDTIQHEFNSYQVVQLPQTVLDAKRIDEQWHSIGLIKDISTGQPKFANLSALMKGILVIFHSNADCERIFSQVTKNKTEFRPNMSTKTLGSLLTRKTVMLAHSQVCHTMQHTNDELSRAKSATYVCLNEPGPAVLEPSTSGSSQHIS